MNATRYLNRSVIGIKSTFGENIAVLERRKGDRDFVKNIRVKNQCHQVSVCDDQWQGVVRVEHVVQRSPSAIQNVARRLASGCVKVVVIE